MTEAPDSEGALFAGDNRFLGELQREAAAESDRLGVKFTLDIWFYVFLRRFSRFGFFNYGPITIDVRLLGDIVERTSEPLPPGERRYEEDFVRFSLVVVEELKRSGQTRIDELHILLAFMRFDEGLPGRVFGELGVTYEQVEQFARSGGRPQASRQTGEKLYSPEEAADYLGVHVQTVRTWIRTGRLKASRLAGQRALRISASDLQSVLEPIDADDV
jgi:excisionase family DNA binding protein